MRVSNNKYKSRSLSKYVYKKYEIGVSMSPVRIAKVGDWMMDKTRLEVAEMIAEKLSHVLVKRGEITDYQFRKLPKITLGRYSYGLKPTTEEALQTNVQNSARYRGNPFPLQATGA